MLSRRRLAAPTTATVMGEGRGEGEGRWLRRDALQQDGGGAHSLSVCRLPTSACAKSQAVQLIWLALLALGEHRYELGCDHAGPRWI